MSSIVKGYLVHVTAEDGRRTYAATSLVQVDSIAEHTLGRSIDTMPWRMVDNYAHGGVAEPWTEGALPQGDGFLVSHPLHIYCDMGVPE